MVQFSRKNQVLNKLLQVQPKKRVVVILPIQMKKKDVKVIVEILNAIALQYLHFLHQVF